MKKIFVTGGHYTPARAVIEQLKKYKVFYIGRKYATEGDTSISLEFQEMPKYKNVTFLEITTGRLQRTFTKNTLTTLFKIPVGLVQSLYWIMKYKPDAVLSFGGYVAIPVSTLAYLFTIPIVTHEQVPAFDYPSKYLNMLARKVLVSFPHLVKTKEIYTGNPVRTEIFHATKSINLPRRKTIYVTGGNQGSHVINSAVLGCLPKILEKYNLIWQTGDNQEFKDFDRVTVKSSNLLIRKFVSSQDIGAVFRAADLVISRSGANTVTELAALGKPSILIPIPWVHDSEQQQNANFLANFGGSKIIKEESLTSELLFSEIDHLLDNLNYYRKKSADAKQVYMPSAAQKIVSELEEVLSEKKN